MDEIIRSLGFRITPQRREFLDILNQRHPLGVELLKWEFMKRTKANLTTFYRVLMDFRAHGFIHSIHEDGQELVCLCEEIRQNKIPSHSYELLHCHACGNIQDLHLPDISGNLLSSRREIHVEKCVSCE